MNFAGRLSWLFAQREREDTGYRTAGALIRERVLIIHLCARELTNCIPYCKYCFFFFCQRATLETRATCTAVRVRKPANGTEDGIQSSPHCPLSLLLLSFFLFPPSPARVSGKLVRPRVHIVRETMRVTERTKGLKNSKMMPHGTKRSSKAETTRNGEEREGREGVGSINKGLHPVDDGMVGGGREG